MSTPSEQASDKSTRQRGASECKSLIAASTKNLFRKNAFRITGIAVDATTREVIRHADKLKMLVELGQAPHAKDNAHPLDPPPTVDEIREAIQKIKDPEKRLIDEFFWFWPEEFGKSDSDPALQALTKGDTKTANEIWRKRINEKSYGIVAKHNLAVAYYLIALDLGHLATGKTISEESRVKISDTWKSSVRKWGRIQDDEKLWEKVTDRIRQLNEPSLPTGFARRMRASLPDALNKINADLIFGLAESGKIEIAKDYIAYIRETNQTQNGFKTAAEQFLLPAKNRQKEQMRQALKQAEKMPGEALKAAREILKQSQQTLEIFDLFFGSEGDVRNDIFDETASTCNRLQILYHKETRDDVGCLEILKAILPLANSSELKKAIERDVSETCARLERKGLENVYDLLKLIQNSQESPAKRLSRFKREAASAIANAAGVSGFSENFGFLAGASENVKELYDSAATVLRGISLEAWNEHNDGPTAVEANKMAILYATNPDVKKRLAEDKSTLDKQNIHYLDGPGWQRPNAGTKGSKVHPGAGMVILGIVGILVVWGVIGSRNSTTDTPHSTTYESDTPSANTYTPTPTSGRGSSGNNTYRVPSYVSSELDREKAEIEADRVALNRLSDRVDALGREIESDPVYLDNTSQYAVDEFNEKVERYNVLAQQAKAATAAFNLRVDNYNARLRSNAR